MDSKTLGELLGPVVASVGLEVDAIEVVPAGKRRVLRVTLDGDGHKGTGPDLDQIAEATRAISRVLDESTVVGNQPYTLEVSSRGVGRPLTRLEHYRRNRGRLIATTLADGRQITARITGVEGETISLDVKGQARTLVLDDIAKALVQVEMNRREHVLDDAGEDDTDVSLELADDEIADDDEIANENEETDSGDADSTELDEEK